MKESEQLNFLDLLQQIELEEEQKRKAEKPYYNDVGEPLPWEVEN